MFICLLLLSAEDLLACSCVANLKPLKQQVTDAYKNSIAIFSGEVLSVTPTDEFTVTVKIKIEKSWKGRFSKEIILTTGKDSAMCGYSFEIGNKYLVYAYGPKNKLTTGLCSRTGVLSQSEDLKYLDQLKKRAKGKAK
jgi:hypothetical protein